MTNLSINRHPEEEIKEVFLDLGFSDKETTLYLTLLKNGPATLTPLSQQTGLPVSTVQSVLQKLEKELLVTVSANKSRKVYLAKGPESIIGNFKRKITDIAQITPLIEAVISENKRPAKVQVFRNKQMIEVFEKALNCKSKIVYEIVSAKELQEILGEKFHFTKRRVERKIKLNSLRVESREIKKYSKLSHIRELRESKFLPKELNFKSSIMFWDNSVAYFTTKEEGLAVLIESPANREAIEQIFKLLWQLGKPMITVQE